MWCIEGAYDRPNNNEFPEVSGVNLGIRLDLVNSVHHVEPELLFEFYFNATCILNLDAGCGHTLGDAIAQHGVKAPGTIRFDI